VVVAVQGLDPAIPSLNGKPTSDTLRCEQLVPILLAVGESVLQIEREVRKDFAAVGAAEALRMEVGAKSLQTIPDNLTAALAALRGQVCSITVLTIQFSLFLHKSHVLQRLSAAVHVADKVAGTPGPAQSCDKGAPDGLPREATHWDSHARLLLLQHTPPPPWG